MNKTKVLIIEDEKYVLENIATLLEEEGYVVKSSSNVFEGITAALQFKPDLIISDVMMPGMSGYDVLKTLSENDATKSIPFIFLTAKVESEDLRKGMQLGADDYLFKPYKSEELLSAIESRLKRINALREGEVSNKEEVRRHSYSERLFITTGTQPVLLKINEIKFISAENQYTSVHLTGGKTLLVRKSLSYWENILPLNEFLRIHRSTILNMEYISKIGKWDNSSMFAYIEGISEPFIISKRYAAKLRRSFSDR